MPRRSQVPTASRGAGWVIAIQESSPPVQTNGCIGDVDEENPICKALDDLDRIDTLPVQLRRIESEPQFLRVAYRFQHHLGAVVVERHLARPQGAGQLDAALLASVEN